MTEGRLSEGEIIATIREMAGGHAPGIAVPIGDDAAAFSFAAETVLLTTDSIYEGIHFNLDTYSLSDVGWKAAAAGVSDIAAMGGEPSCALLSLAFEEAPTEREVRSLIGGMLEMLSSIHCALVGGDVCRSTCGLALTVTVAGTPPPGGPVLRGGAGEGDLLGVTGTPGDSGAGLFILSRRSEALRAAFPGLVEAHLRPRPRVDAGRLLAASGATAMEDISDGLAADVLHLCEESGLGCVIDEGGLPVSEEARRLAESEGIEPLGWVYSGGEDYELLFTAPPGTFEEALGNLLDHGIPAACIGVMKEACHGRVALRDGKPVDIEKTGFDHFR